MESMGIDTNRFFAGTYNNKRVLITGDTGFKGSWLAIWLKAMGAEVWGYALPPRSDFENFARCGMGSAIHHQDGDIRDGEALLGYFQKVQPDMAFHLAAQAIVLDSYDEPHYTFETNLMGAVNFFEAVRKTPSVKAAVNITSDKCYQNNEWLWGYRENDPMGGNDPYSASKGCSELITHSYHHSFFRGDGSCHVASARAGNVIGGGDWAPYRIVPDFFRAIKENQELIIRNPEAVRPWQHVLEPLGGYLLLGAMLLQEGERFSGGWNFGPADTNNCQVKQLIESIIRVTGKGNYIVPLQEKAPHEAQMLKLDISKASTLLNWKPVLNFGETVEFTANGYMEELMGKDNLYECRLAQLDQYLQLAAGRGISWAQAKPGSILH
jgi:CDP-glucose 4,6-dehydratase